MGSVAHNPMFIGEVVFKNGRNVIVLSDFVGRNQTKTCPIFGQRGPDKYHAIFFWLREARLGKLAGCLEPLGHATFSKGASTRSKL